MTSPQMVCHLNRSLKMALGDLAIPVRKTFLGNRVVRHLVIHRLPFPKGAPTSPMLQTPAEEAAGRFEADRAEMRELVARFGRCVPEGIWAPHPAFGDLSGRDWGVLVARHMDHHLRQFGI